ncbi:MAG: HlyD family efflux transporter periplasmic adaptor subunit [Crocinitomix sp.]|nr:HlyD family efflux transporter periplasmic adaptor subunit [Crocinitomix sp.]
MLNISNSRVSKYIVPKKFSALENVEKKVSGKVLPRIIYTSLILFIIILLLPWTQNIRSNGTVTTLKPNERPQSLNSVIGGQIEQWYVQEGDHVRAGDTILKIKEVKDAYFDEKLLPRTQDQLDFKRESILAYTDKIKTLEEQLIVLRSQRDLKLSQTRIKYQQAGLKVQNDSIGYRAALINFETAQFQYKRQDSLYRSGLKSLTDLETKNLKLQATQAYMVEAKNKWLNSQNELISLQLELSNVQIKFETDFNKIQSDKFSTMSNKLDTETAVSKLENQYSNYAYRNGLYFITAPQNGYITKTTSNGLGETIKAGEEILTIMPSNYNLAVELYVEPIDLPLIKVNEKVRLQFDGWPAIVFSGWPSASYGTYGGKVYAIDQYISSNGKYRVLVSPDPDDNPWPEALRFGSGSSSMMLLSDVPIWYELWRKINGFPPNFYHQQPTKTTKK